MSKTKKNINIVHNNDDKIDKILILNRIKSYYKFKKQAELARFLGIKTNTIANWYKRNTGNLELILTKCDDLNPNWIINGSGKPTKSYLNSEEIEPSLAQEKEGIYNLANPNENEIERLNQVISVQEKTIAAQAKTIEVMEQLLNKNEV